MKGRMFWFMLLFGLSVSAVIAQDVGECPTRVLLALGRAGAVCNGIGIGELCYGNGSVSSSIQPDADAVPLSRPGDIQKLSVVQAVTVGNEGAPGDEWSVARLEALASPVGVQQRSVTILMYGDAYVANTVPYTPEIVVSATGTVNIRALPEENAEIIEKKNVRDTLRANGRTDNNKWLRVIIPRSGKLGWIAAANVTSESSIELLQIVDVGSPYYQPFQTISIQTGRDDAICDGTSDSGVLIQTPNTTDFVQMVVNGAPLRIAAAVYIQAEPDGLMTLNVLNGHLIFDLPEEPLYIPAGARLEIPLNDASFISYSQERPEPYIYEDVEFVPVNNLPQRVQLMQPLTGEQITTLTEAFKMPDIVVETVTSSSGVERCTHVTRRGIDLWAGPGTFYEVIGSINANVAVRPAVQITTSDGSIWWQLSTGQWVPASAIESSSVCGTIPTTNVIRPPRTNTFNMETCEARNGPLRPGQRVTIEFVPPGWDTLYEAQQATNIYPGIVKVDNQWLYVRSSRPIEISKERYILRFSARWTATAGQHRIEAGRLSYNLICEVTVSVGTNIP